jgi:small-conductance mechanosensitive channel
MVGSLIDRLGSALDQLVEVALGLILAAAVCAVALLIAGQLRRKVRRWLAHALLPENAKTLVESFAAILVYVGAATFLLRVWGVDWSTLFAAIGVSTLVVALGLQGVLQSLVGGVFVLFEHTYNVGDRVRFSGQDFTGTVERIGFRTTVIQTETGHRVYAPNSLIFTTTVINESPERARLTIVSATSLGATGRTEEQVRALIRESLAEIPNFEIAPHIQVKARLGRFAFPRIVARFPWLGNRLIKLSAFVSQRSIRVRVTWTGPSELVALDEIQRRLKELFPECRVTVRQW